MFKKTRRHDKQPTPQDKQPILRDEISSDMLIFEDEDTETADRDDDFYVEPLRRGDSEDVSGDSASSDDDDESGDSDDDDDDDNNNNNNKKNRNKNHGRRSDRGGRRFHKPNLEFTPEELPLLGYAIASLVFFFAAVTRKHRTPAAKALKNTSLAAPTSDSAAGLYNEIMGNIYDEMSVFDDDGFDDTPDNNFAMMGSVFEACEASYNDICGKNNHFLVDSVGGGGGHGGRMLPTAHFAYALCLGIAGASLGVGIIAWMRHNASKAAERRAEFDENDDNYNNGGDNDNDGGDPLETFSEDEEDKTGSEVVLEKYRWLVNGVLLLWAAIGWAFFTFGGNDVFAYTGNGFFALWAMLFFALWNFGITPDILREHSENADSCIYALVATSVITIIELTTGLGGWRYRGNRGISGYALVVSASAILFGLLTACFSFVASRRRSSAELDIEIRFWAVVAILVLSIVAAFLTTFIGPFLTTGNGYFAVWGSVVFSGLAFSKLKQERHDNNP